MSYRVRHALEIVASLDTAEEEVQLKRATTAQITNIQTEVTEGLTNSMIVAVSASDVALPFGGVTTGYVLYLEADREITLKINGGSESFKVRPMAGSSGYKAKLLWEGEFASLSVSNADAANTVNLTYMIAGV